MGAVLKRIRVQEEVKAEVRVLTSVVRCLTYHLLTYHAHVIST